MITRFTNLLTERPLFGFVGSILSISLTQLQVLQMVGAVLGIVIAVITAILKVMELKDKLKAREKADPEPPKKTYPKRKPKAP